MIFRSVGQRSVSKVKPFLYMLGKGGISVLQTAIFSFTVMPNFAEKVEIAVDALSCNPQREVDENEFIDASRLVYDGVVDIRQAVLMDRVGIKIKYVL